MHLGQVLDRLASAGFTLRATKCAVGVWIRDPVGGLGRPQTGRGGSGWLERRPRGRGRVRSGWLEGHTGQGEPQLSERMSSRSSASCRALRVSEHELVNTSI